MLYNPPKFRGRKITFGVSKRGKMFDTEASDFGTYLLTVSDGHRNRLFSDRSLDCDSVRD